MSTQLRLRNYMAEAAENIGKKCGKQTNRTPQNSLVCKAEDCFKHHALETNLPFDISPLILPQSFWQMGRVKPLDKPVAILNHCRNYQTLETDRQYNYKDNYFAHTEDK